MEPGHIFMVQPNGLNSKSIVWVCLGESETDTGQQANQGFGEAIL